MYLFFLLLFCAFRVIPKIPLAKSRIWKFVFVSSKSFIALKCSYLGLFCIWHEIKVQHHSCACRSSVVRHWSLFFPPLNCIGILATNHFVTDIRVYFCILHSIPFTDISIFMEVSHCFGYCSFKERNCEFSNLSFLWLLWQFEILWNFIGIWWSAFLRVAPSYMPFLVLRKFSIPRLLSIFLITKGCRIFSKAFEASLKLPCGFSPHSINVVYYID